MTRARNGQLRDDCRVAILVPGQRVANDDTDQRSANELRIGCLRDLSMSAVG